jgi:UV DNA damage endonuclease
MKQRTWLSEGLNRANELTILNCEDLLKIIEWNEQHNIKFFRISSGLFPWMTEYEFEELKDFNYIKDLLLEAGNLARKYNQRVEFHPGHFTILASLNPQTLKRSIKEIEQHSRIFDLMGYEPNHWTPINIHVGVGLNEKDKAAKRWCENFYKLSDNCKKRLTIENDDKPGMFNVKDLYDLIYVNTKVPIVFDNYHHKFNDGDLSAYEAANLAAKTWKTQLPVIHWSSSLKLHEDPTARYTAHADYIYETLNNYDIDAYFMFETKTKELSVLEYIEKGPRKYEIISI